MWHCPFELSSTFLEGVVHEPVDQQLAGPATQQLRSRKGVQVTPEKCTLLETALPPTNTLLEITKQQLRSWKCVQITPEKCTLWEKALSPTKHTVGIVKLFMAAQLCAVRNNAAKDSGRHNALLVIIKMSAVGSWLLDCSVWTLPQN